ncbi:MAG: hypothetical protein OXN84_13370 [Albidovulum sp.]|nr:hypothetical protein [Albidovulum sp.]
MPFVEMVNSEFATSIAGFPEAGGNQAGERSAARREYYLFYRPSDESFPAMIEPFARRLDAPSSSGAAALARIPVENDVISLSAIHVDDEYFEALEETRRIVADIVLVDEGILIPLKARAFLGLSLRKAEGENVDRRHVRRHRGDVYLLVRLLPDDGSLALAASIRDDLRESIGRTLGNPDFDCAAFELLSTLVYAEATIGRYYRLEVSG